MEEVVDEVEVLTLSKKQRPTSSGQSVNASSSFRNVLVGKVEPAMIVKNVQF